MPEGRDESGKRSLAVFHRLTKGELKKAWNNLKTLARATFAGTEGLSLSGEGREHIRAVISDCVHTKRGEASSRSRAVELGSIYLNLSPEGRRMFHHVLAHDFDVDEGALLECLSSLGKAETTEDRVRAEIALKEALVPPRLGLLRQFSSLPNGIKFLIDMRADLLPIVEEDPFLYRLSIDLKEILAAWFDVGLLDLKEITWDSPAALLEKLIAYEAVHQIRSWDDLRRRLTSDRRCFAFFHNKMPLEPLIFVEVALVNGMSDNIQELLESEHPEPALDRADTAIFYSITSTQPGLTGIHLGSFLIKTVVEQLSREMPALKHFATLSPVPGFRRWVEAGIADDGEGILTAAEGESIRSRYGCEDGAVKLRDLLAGDWVGDGDTVEFLKPILMRLCVRYLVMEKKGDRAMDPVAHFHLNNGARLERINWLGNASADGLERSFGIMVNYYYKLSDIEKNHEEYVTRSEVILGRDVRAMMKKVESGK